MFGYFLLNWAISWSQTFFSPVPVQDVAIEIGTGAPLGAAAGAAAWTAGLVGSAAGFGASVGLAGAGAAAAGAGVFVGAAAGAAGAAGAGLAGSAAGLAGTGVAVGVAAAHAAATAVRPSEPNSVNIPLRVTCLVTMGGVSPLHPCRGCPRNGPSISPAPCRGK